MINIYLTASPKNDTHKDYIRKYVIEEMAKRLKIREDQIKIFDTLDEDLTLSPDVVRNIELYNISKVASKMALCNWFVVFKTYLFELLSERSSFEHTLWTAYGPNQPITIWELD